MAMKTPQNSLSRRIYSSGSCLWFWLCLLSVVHLSGFSYGAPDGGTAEGGGGGGKTVVLCERHLKGTCIDYRDVEQCPSKNLADGTDCTLAVSVYSKCCTP